MFVCVKRIFLGGLALSLIPQSPFSSAQTPKATFTHFFSSVYSLCLRKQDIVWDIRGGLSEDVEGESYKWLRPLWFVFAGLDLETSLPRISDRGGRWAICCDNVKENHSWGRQESETLKGKIFIHGEGWARIFLRCCIKSSLFFLLYGCGGSWLHKCLHSILMAPSFFPFRSLFIVVLLLFSSLLIENILRSISLIFYALAHREE